MNSSKIAKWCVVAGLILIALTYLLDGILRFEGCVFILAVVHIVMALIEALRPSHNVNHDSQ